MNELPRPENSQPTIHLSNPTTDSDPSTQQKQADMQRSLSGKDTSTSMSAELQTPPYPQRLRRKKNNERQFKRFLDVLKQLHINIPLVEALEQMPTYAKFLKDILSKKRGMGEYETIALTQECSDMVCERVPTKMKDPGSFTIPCSIGGIHIGKALCDLGASINLMPLSVFNKLGIASQPTTVTLQLADRSVVHPEGRIEDVLVKVDKFILPADFIILDYEADEDVPIILGRPFLSTGRTLIDVHKGEIIMRVNDQEVIFNVFKALEYPGEQETCQNLDAEDELHEMLLEENDETIANLDAQQPEQCCALVHSTFETLTPNQINQ